MEIGLSRLKVAAADQMQMRPIVLRTEGSACMGLQFLSPGCTSTVLFWPSSLMARQMAASSQQLSSLSPPLLKQIGDTGRSVLREMHHLLQLLLPSRVA